MSKEAFVDLQAAVLCNLAACFLKLGDGPSALEIAGRASRPKAVAADSSAGIKAAYRRACALEAAGDWDEARDAFKSVQRGPEELTVPPGTDDDVDAVSTGGISGASSS